MENEVIFVSGQRGSGKTHWVKHFIGGLSRYLLYDTLSEYEEGPRFDDIEALIEHCKKQLSSYSGQGFFEAVYDPLEHEDFPHFCRVALALGNLYVVIEEIDLFSTPFQSPIELQALIKYGRHQKVNIIGVSRRPSEVSRLFTSQATRFILFKQIEPRDIAYFKSIIGNGADWIPGLNRFDYLDVDFSSEEVFRGDLPYPQRLPGPISPPISSGVDKPETV